MVCEQSIKAFLNHHPEMLWQVEQFIFIFMKFCKHFITALGCRDHLSVDDELSSLRDCILFEVASFFFE